jgi:peptidoglycan hydrolase CwlO-like protein
MASRSEPVRHTCPDIDHVIGILSGIVKDAERIDENDEKEDILSYIRDWIPDLKDIAIGSKCDMENLRSSNEALRSWGNDLVRDLDTAEDEINDLQSQIDDKTRRAERAESDLEDAQLEISDLKAEIETLQNTEI